MKGWADEGAGGTIIATGMQHAFEKPEFRCIV